MTRVLVLGVTGMLGHTLFRELSTMSGLDVWGSARRSTTRPAPTTSPGSTGLITDFTADARGIGRALSACTPDVVINCVGLIKQHSHAGDAVEMIATNSLFPHLAAQECAAGGARFVHVSTDCVFSGAVGNYGEDSTPDATDLYGRSKLLGEVDSPALTLRTSIIGHELRSAVSLVDWFLSQTGPVRGFRNAIYTGLTTTEFARLLATVVIPRPDLAGLYQVAAASITKYELLRKIARTYGWQGELVPFDDFRCDRSLRADAFRAATGYIAPDWDEMIAEMHRHQG